MSSARDDDGQAPIFSMKALKAITKKTQDGFDTSPKARKTRHNEVRQSVDGRSLRATGRTEHLNFKAKPAIKDALARHVPKGGISLFIEEAIVKLLKERGVEVDEDHNP